MDRETYDEIFGNPSKEEIQLISKIARRFRGKLIEWEAAPREQLQIEMDVTAAHCSCPLKLQALLDADDFNFVHDLGGIQNHLNRDSGKLENCFVPRFAKGIKNMTDAELVRIAGDEENTEYDSALEELELRHIDDDRVRQAQGEPTNDRSGMLPS